MTNTTAKTLLAQADQLMRRARPPEDLPVLTDLVRGPAKASPPLTKRPTQPPELDERVDDLANYAGAIALPQVEELDANASRDARADFASGASKATANPSQSTRSQPASGSLSFSPTAPPAPAPSPQRLPPTPAAATSAARPGADAPLGVTREQLNALLSKRLEQMQHSVYSQVMQQLELHASGKMKENLVAVLVPALSTLANDIATRVAEDTANQMQEVIAEAVEKEVARLRDQLSQKRDYK
jgi:hypothetical protein